MRHQEGLRISALEEDMLERAGILKSDENSPPAVHAGLSAESVQLFLLIAQAGEEGLAKSRIPKDLSKELTTHLLPLELHALVTWERDNRGQLTYLVLTWKGQDALVAARNPLPVKKSWASRRKFSVSD